MLLSENGGVSLRQVICVGTGITGFETVSWKGLDLDHSCLRMGTYIEESGFTASVMVSVCSACTRFYGNVDT